MKKYFILLSTISMNFLYSQNIMLDNNFGTNGYSDSFNIWWNSDTIMLPDGKFITGYIQGTSTRQDIYLRRLNQNGTLDDTFDVKRFDIGNRDELLRKMVLVNNKIILSGRVRNNGLVFDLFVGRSNFDGNIDNNFGTNGFITISLGASQNQNVIDLVGDDNGNIYLLASNGDFYLFKINSTGVMDSSFGVNGKLLLSSDGSNYGFNKVYIQNDGKIILGGKKKNIATNKMESYIERRLQNSDLDVTFGNNGIVTIPNVDATQVKNFAYDYDSNSIIILHQSDRSQLYPNIFLSKIQMSNGSLISNFGANGITPNYSFTGAPDLGVNQITILPNSKIIVGGNISNFSISPNLNNDLLLLRFNSNGLLDYSVSNDGYQVFETTPPNVSMRADVINKIFNLNDGSFILAYFGGSATLSYERPYLAKFKNNEILTTQNITSENTISLYPNPSFDYIVITNNNLSGNFNYKIYDLTGKIIKKGNTKFNEAIAIEDLAKGNYLIQIEYHDIIKRTIKLVKK